jgi:branched-chain amino acid transport system substrate-binding protein
MKFRSHGPALGFCCVCMSMIVSALPVGAQTAPGVTDKEILIGSCSALEGPSRSLGTETVAGAKAYFSLVNDEGGVHDRKLRLLSYDDSYDPAKTQGCFEKLQADKVFA